MKNKRHLKVCLEALKEFNEKDDALAFRDFILVQLEIFVTHQGHDRFPEFDLYDFCDNNHWKVEFRDVYHDPKGFNVSTDGSILCVIKDRTVGDGNFHMKDGSVYNYKPLPYREVLKKNDKTLTKFDIVFDNNFVLFLRNFIEECSILDVKAVLKFDFGYFYAENLLRMCSFVGKNKDCEYYHSHDGRVVSIYIKSGENMCIHACADPNYIEDPGNTHLFKIKCL